MLAIVQKTSLDWFYLPDDDVPAIREITSPEYTGPMEVADVLATQIDEAGVYQRTTVTIVDGEEVIYDADIDN